ncbi:nicotinate (nicotinamide) nucleotide adenylyltransferase [candidate division KSB1 bacterium]|nr:nicotinate (nicotinamide) nucleotide adenylyltransferase [candidate division KSB1 bacterium]
MNIGLYGGTFDPVHIGHLLLAEWIREELDLRKIIFIPAAIPPHKQEKEITPSKIRMQMLEYAIRGNSSFKISDFELRNDDVSYSLTTILHFRESLKISRDNLFFIIGADNLVTFSSWHKPKEVLRNSSVVVYRRSGNKLSDVPDEFLNEMLVMNNPLIDISSSEIRERIRDGKTIKYMVPPKIETLIFENNLYKNKS